MEAQIKRNLVQFTTWLCLAALTGALLGCSTGRRVTEPQELGQRAFPSVGSQPQAQKETMGPTEPYGPPVPEQLPDYGPQPIQSRAMVLVLGPGMARAFSYIGVLEALRANQIPIAAIVGSEMGALMGALYLTSASVNQFEWKVLKLKEDFFVTRSLLGDSKIRSELGGTFLQWIQQNLGPKAASDSSIPIYFGAQSKRGFFEIIHEGSLARQVEQSFRGGGSVRSVAEQWTFLIDFARSLNLGPTVAINVLEERDSSRVKGRLEKADLVIRPEMPGIGYLDFHKKTEAAFRGKNAIIQNIADIKRQVEGAFVRE